MALGSPDNKNIAASLALVAGLAACNLEDVPPQDPAPETQECPCSQTLEVWVHGGPNGTFESRFDATEGERGLTGLDGKSDVFRICTDSFRAIAEQCAETELATVKLNGSGLVEVRLRNELTGQTEPTEVSFDSTSRLGAENGQQLDVSADEATVTIRRAQ